MAADRTIIYRETVESDDVNSALSDIRSTLAKVIMTASFPIPSIEAIEYPMAGYSGSEPRVGVIS
jgi:hypothetical protein